MSERNEGTDGVRPVYDSADFFEYCDEQKRKGLRRSLWRTLPQMWEEELKFRAEFEGAINKACGFSSPHQANEEVIE